MSFKETIDQVLLERMGITSANEQDRDDFFLALSEVLEAKADDLEEKEPYATRAIENDRSVAREVYDYESFIGEDAG